MIYLSLLMLNFSFFLVNSHATPFVDVHTYVVFINKVS